MINGSPHTGTGSPGNVIAGEIAKMIAPHGHRLTTERILAAIDRAKRRDNPACTDWPRTVGTTVYKLVEQILRDSSD